MTPVGIRRCHAGDCATMSAVTASFSSFAALGDSFTEGLDDPNPDGTSAEGHRRIAAAVLEALGVDPGTDWRAELAPMSPVPWTRARVDDVRWARTHLAPWLHRRLTGRSSGDGIEPKRPVLSPVDSR